MLKYGVDGAVVNNISITLVPKVPNASSMSQFQPNYCCIMLYKCIAKILANRLKNILPEFIFLNQTAFISGASTGDNVLVAQEFIKGYQHRTVSPRCMIKVTMFIGLPCIIIFLLSNACKVYRLGFNMHCWSSIFC